MATRTIRVDDLDGESDAIGVTFALNGTAYEIDLSEEHLQQLREAMVPYTTVARARTITPPKKASIDPSQLAAIRRWAHSHGYEFSDRGRIPNHVMEAYEKLGHPSSRERAEAAHGAPTGRTLFSATS